MEKIIKQVVDLLKNIVLRDPPRGSRRQSFMVGRRNPFVFSGGFGITWWVTPRGTKAIESIAAMLIRNEVEFSTSDHESVESAISDALHEMCFDQPLFAPDSILFGANETLLECRGIAKVDTFASAVLDLIRATVRERISDWCVVYVAPRISGPSFRIPSEGLSVVARADGGAWREWIGEKYATAGLDPQAASFRGSEFFPFANVPHAYLFVVENHGTVAGSRFEAQIVLRRFFAVCFALLMDQKVSPLHKVMASPARHCLQFQEIGQRAPSWHQSEIGDLLPYYSSEYVLNEDLIASIRTWYAGAESLSPERAERVRAAAHFVNRAMNGGDIDCYINYFIALDALYGRRGAVETSILAGVAALPAGQAWTEKIPRLFDLRSDLVHGGSRHIKEWRSYRDYYRHFDSRPEDDVRQLAFQALRSAPDQLMR